MEELKEVPQSENDKQNSINDTGLKIDPDNEVEFLVSPIAAAFIGLIGGFFLYQIVGALLTVLIFGMDLEKVPVNGLRLMTMAGQILFILLPALIFAKWIYNDVGKIIRIRIPRLNEIGLFTIGIFILTPLLQSYLYIQNHYLDIWAQNSGLIKSLKDFFDTLNALVEKTYGNLLSASNIFEMTLVVLVVAIVPAVAEETMFRGYIQRSFELKLKPYFAIILTALFFSLYHFNPYGLIPLFILGAYFGFTAYISKSLVIPMILHFLNNFTAVMLYYFIGDDELIDSGAIANGSDLISYITMFAGLTFLFVILLYFIKRFYNVKYSKQE
jgi:membrane protease YdiL (CAAX protease family)